MRLARVTVGASYDVSSSKYEGSGREVWVGFHRFGKGHERRPDFAVYLTWRDVEAIIERFSRQGHPKALALKSSCK